MANNNRTEAQSAINSALVPTLTLAQLKALHNNQLTSSFAFDKDVIGSQAPTGGTIVIDYSNKDTATVTIASNLSVSFTGMQNGMVKHLVITKQAANTVTFSGAVDATKNKRSIGFLTSIVYRISNKNNIITVEGLTPDFTSLLNRIEIEIGAWNMVTLRNLSVSLSLDADKIRKIDAFIVSDDGTFAAPLDGYGINVTSLTDEGVHGGVSFFRDSLSSLNLWRRDSGFFDDFIFSGSGNRGWVTIEYVD